MDNRMKREFVGFVKRYRLESELENVKRMLEVSLQMNEASVVGDEKRYLMLLEEFSTYYCLTTHEMLREFYKLLALKSTLV